MSPGTAASPGKDDWKVILFMLLMLLLAGSAIYCAAKDIRSGNVPVSACGDTR